MSTQTINRLPQPDNFSEPTSNFRAGNDAWPVNGMTPPNALPDRTEAPGVDREGRLIRAIGRVTPVDVDYRVPAQPRNVFEDPTVPIDDVPDTADPDTLLTPDELNPRGSVAPEQNRLTYFHNPDQIRRAQDLAEVLRHTAEQMPIIRPRPARHARPDDLFEQTPLPPTATTTPRVYHGRHHRE